MVVPSLVRLAKLTAERTLIAVKPDGVQRGIVGQIISRFEQRGFKLVALKLTKPSEEHLAVHYEEHLGKPHFPKLIKYMSMGPVVAMVWEGSDIVQQGRRMLGATDPLSAGAGTIRGDFALDKGRNVCHGSSSVDAAQKEISHWFQEKEICDYHNEAIEKWMYED